MKNIWQIVVFSITLALCACSTTPTPGKIALLAPFEGGDADSGYEALYAAQMALTDVDPDSMRFTLLPLDVGGATFAADRARALADDPDVVAVMVLGEHAADPATLTALGDLPIIIIGNAGFTPSQPNITVITNAPPIDEEFVARYLEDNPFASPPTQRAGQTYFALLVLLAALETDD